MLTKGNLTRGVGEGTRRLKHGQLQSGSNAKCKSGLDPDCVHRRFRAAVVCIAYPCKQSISGKMAFEELLVIVLSFWLRSRRARRRRARIRRAAALRRICYAVMETQRQMLLCVLRFRDVCYKEQNFVDKAQEHRIHSRYRFWLE